MGIASSHHFGASDSLEAQNEHSFRFDSRARRKANRVNLEFKVNRTRVETLFTDLALAATFASIAESSSQEKRQRNLDNARRACYVIKNKLLPLCTLTDVEKARMKRELRDLEHRLWGLSQDLQTSKLMAASSAKP